MPGILRATCGSSMPTARHRKVRSRYCAWSPFSYWAVLPDAIGDIRAWIEGLERQPQAVRLERPPGRSEHVPSPMGVSGRSGHPARTTDGRRTRWTKPNCRRRAPAPRRAPLPRPPWPRTTERASTAQARRRPSPAAPSLAGPGRSARAGAAQQPRPRRRKTPGGRQPVHPQAEQGEQALTRPVLAQHYQQNARPEQTQGRHDDKGAEQPQKERWRPSLSVRGDAGVVARHPPTGASRLHHGRRDQQRPERDVPGDQPAHVEQRRNSATERTNNTSAVHAVSSALPAGPPVPGRTGLSRASRPVASANAATTAGRRAPPGCSFAGCTDPASQHCLRNPCALTTRDSNAPRRASAREGRATHAA
jgi:hypothetical protein